MITSQLFAGSALDLSALKIVSGKRCWVLQIDGLVLSADGNLLGALSIATKVKPFWMDQLLQSIITSDSEVQYAFSLLKACKVCTKDKHENKFVFMACI